MNLRILHKSPDFNIPKPELEQYATPSEIVEEIIKQAYSLGHLSGKVADLGSGTGRLAIGAAIFGADITAYEIDEDPLEIAQDYAKKNNLKIKWKNKSIESINEKYETVIMNPPFGSQRPGADIIFLKKALEISENIWTIHLSSTREFIEKFVKNNKGEIITAYEFMFPIERTMEFHSKDVKEEKAILYHIASLE